MTAIIRWKRPEEGGRKTPPGDVYRTIVHFESDGRWPDEQWTFVVSAQWLSPGGEFMVAEVRYLMENAPHQLLAPGAKFELLEGPRVVATGMVMPAERTLAQVQELAHAI